MYMLDTNTVSHLFRRHAGIIAKLKTLPPSKISISSITEAELRYGLAKRQNKALAKIVATFLESVTVHSWDSKAAKSYGELRALMEKTGRVMGTMDQLIAAHAASKGLTIVTNDAAFSMAPGLHVEDWTKSDS